MKEILSFIERSLGPKLFATLASVITYLFTSPDIKGIVDTLINTEINSWGAVVFAYFATYFARLAPAESIKSEPAKDSSVVKNHFQKIDYPEIDSRSPKIDEDRFKEDLVRHEGIRAVIYPDIFGHKTAGIGHLIREDDPEYDLPMGTKINQDRVLYWFEQDTQFALQDAQKIFPEFNTYPMEARLVLANMSFQLGYVRLSEFKKTITLIRLRNWKAAAIEMLYSDWAQQTPERANELSKRISSLT